MLRTKPKTTRRRVTTFVGSRDLINDALRLIVAEC